MKTKTLKYLLFLQVAIATASFGQNELKRTNHWYFSDKAGIDFTSGSPVVDNSGQLFNGVPSAVISDTAGNLLFYASFDTVWNKNHQVMNHR